MEYSWAVFRCVGPSPDAIQAMWDRIYNEWLPIAEYELIPDYYIENYLQISDEGMATLKDELAEGMEKFFGQNTSI